MHCFNLNTHETKWKRYTLIEKPVLIGYLDSKGYGVQNQLPLSFGTALVCDRLLKVKSSPHTHTY